MPGVLLDRVTIAFCGVLAGYAVLAAIAGFKANELMGPGDADATRRIVVVTVVHAVFAVLWPVAAVLLGRRVKAGRAIVAVLAAAYLALNAFWVDSMYSIMVTMFVIQWRWGSDLIFGDRPGERVTVAGAGLSGLMLILLLVSVVRARQQRQPLPGHRYR
ncbi:hypothetical protein ACFWM1_08620 [Nocardia sp. NPDC058379]|uniref:hypothetical protein n=1 Tax=unclassified Nocardia TaxID=2637762 RepID=UPI003663D4F5